MATRALIDHDEIKKWARERNAKPSEVAATATDEDVGILRMDLPGYSGAGSLREISWDDWLAKFDENELALLVQDETREGRKSNFNKLVKRESARTTH